MTRTSATAINVRKAAAARKPASLLSVSKATTQARTIVDRILTSSVRATVESKLSHDLAEDVPTVTTTITFPADVWAETKGYLDSALAQLPEWRKSLVDSSRIVITRSR